MVVYEQVLSSGAQGWVAIIKIDGIGRGMHPTLLESAGRDGRYHYCTEVPAYGKESHLIWRDELLSFPDLLSERAPRGVGGGFPDLGELTFSILDFEDHLTSTLATEGSPQSALTAALTSSSSDSTVNVGSVSGVSQYDVIWIGSEALHVLAIGASSYTVTRGFLGTDPTAHSVTARVWTKTPYVKNRRVSLYLAPLDAQAKDETLIGSYVIDTGPDWRVGEDGSAGWFFAAKSQAKFLGQIAPRKTRTATIRHVLAQGGGASVSSRGSHDYSGLSWRHWTQTSGHGFYLRHDRSGEIMTADANSLTNSMWWVRRDILQTGQATFEQGDKISQVFVAEVGREECSFRFSPYVPGFTPTPPSTDVSSGTWTPTAHWLEILLIIMLSSAGPNDAGTANVSSGFNNYSSMPSGWGLGMSSTLVDWSGVRALINRTKDWIFPKFVYGDKPQSFAKIATEMLDAVGAYMVTEGGIVKVILPDLPLPGSEVVTLADASDNPDILQREIGPGQFLPEMDVSLAGSDGAEAVEYRVGPSGLSLIFESGDFSEVLEGRPIYALSSPPSVVSVPSGDEDLQELYGRMAEVRLYTSQRTAHEIDLAYDISHLSATIGDSVALKMEGVPNLATGERGWGTVYGRLTEKEPTIDDDLGAHIRGKIMAYPRSVQVARVAPSAVITNVSTNDATVSANVYTQTDNGNGLATSDGVAFSATDVVRIYNTDGTRAAAGATETVSGVVGNVVSLSGNFGGALASDLILAGSNYDDATANQKTEDAHLSDLNTSTPGATGSAPYVFGSP